MAADNRDEIDNERERGNASRDRLSAALEVAAANDIATDLRNAESEERQMAEGDRQIAEGERQRQEGDRQQAEGERQLAEGERQQAEGERQRANPPHLETENGEEAEEEGK